MYLLLGIPKSSTLKNAGAIGIQAGAKFQVVKQLLGHRARIDPCLRRHKHVGGLEKLVRTPAAKGGVVRATRLDLTRPHIHHLPVTNRVNSVWLRCRRL